MMSVQASFHQGDRKFKGKGRQCCVNSAVAIKHLLYLSEPLNWTTQTLNKLLLDGDDLYVALAEKIKYHEFLTFEDISSNIQYLTTSLHGILSCSKTDGPIFSLHDALNELMSEEPKCGCLITIGGSIPAYCMAILRANGLYFVFDPHSRNDAGMLCCEGYATMTTHKDINAVVLFLRHLAASLKLQDAPFEIAKMCDDCQSSQKLTTEACLDLEEVLLTPHSTANAIYYKCRLCTYNFTIYEFESKDGYSHIWNVSVAARGACEIASCLYQNLIIKLKNSKGKTKFIFYSDNCGSQNKNKFHVSMLWFCLQKFILKSITHKYLEKGHTFNEADSMHSAVERASSNILVDTTAQWAATVRLARYKQPYNVKEMCLADFFDFRKVAGLLKNFQVSVGKDKVDWFGFKTLSFSSSNPNVFKYCLDYDGTKHVVDLCGFTRARDIPNPKVMTLT